MKPLPDAAFPRRIETARLRLRRPEQGEATLYARHAQDAYATRPETLSDEKALAFSTFMLGHWERYGFGFLVIDVADAAGKYVPIGHAGFKYIDAWPNHWPENYDAIELGYSVRPRRARPGLRHRSGPSSVDRGVRGVRSAAHFREVQSRQSEIRRRALTLWYEGARGNGKSALV
ncbi:MAG: GNAT family N-acetyltransferase [Candidatus Cybelea sp.]